MNRQYYCKLGCNEELRDMLLELEELGEPIQQDAENYGVYEDSDEWCWLGFDEYEEQWALLEYEPDDGTLVDSEELVDKVKGEVIERNIMRPFPTDAPYWKLRCIKETTYWYSGSSNKVLPHQKFYPGDITWYKLEGERVWRGGDENTIHPEGNKNGVSYRQSDFELLEVVDPTKKKESSKFEKDKWYELKYTYRTRLCNTLVKSTSNTSNRVEFNRYYDLEEKEWRKAIGFSIDSDIKIIYIQERSLEEIQQYLPDGHPDKIKEFVLPEKWCIKVQKHSCPGVVREWRQYPLQNRGDWLDSGYICGDTGYHTGSTKNFPKGYIEITLEQFKKYVLKEGKEKVMYIKCTDSRNSYCTHPQAKEYGCTNYTEKPLKKGKIYKVIKYIEINSGRFGYSCAYGDEHYLIGETGIVVSTKEEYENQFKTEENVKEEFKIGDWIATTNKSYVSYGEIVQVKNIVGDHIYVSPDGWWERKDVRKATPEEIASVTKSEESYKIGDYVVITGNTNNSNNKVGDIGVITEIWSTTVFRVKVDGRSEHGNWSKLTDLRKARPDELEDEIEDKIETYKDGDWVVVLIAAGTSNKDGDVGVVKESSGTSFRVHVPGKQNISNWTSAGVVRKALPHEIPCQLEYVQGLYHKCIHDEPKSLLDREEIEVTIKKTVPKQFNIF